MNQEYICNELGFSNINDYIFNEIKVGYDESIILADKYIENILNEIRNEDTKKKLSCIIMHITLLKKAHLENKELCFTHYYNDSKKFKTPKTLSKTDEFINLSEFIIKYFNIIFHSEKEIIDNLKKIKSQSFLFHFTDLIYSKGEILFDELKSYPELAPLEWTYTTIDLNFLHQFTSTKMLHEFDLQTINESNERNKNYLEDEIENLKKELASSQKEIEFRDNFYEKYYYSTQPFLQDTYFGDNQPLIHCLYYFLRVNNCLDYGWSYFYNCLTIENNEIINLKNTQTNYFFGNLFWELSKFLKEPYKYEFKRFFFNKFYLDEKPLKESFFRNYYRNYKNEEHESLEKISTLVLKIEKIHNKRY